MITIVKSYTEKNAPIIFSEKNVTNFCVLVEIRELFLMLSNQLCDALIHSSIVNSAEQQCREHTEFLN